MTTILLTALILTTVTYTLAQGQALTNQSRGPVDLSIQALNASAPEGRGIYTIIGEVFNNDTVPFNGVRVSATLYDNDGQFLVERSAYTSPSGIQPGMNASFNINVFGTSITGGVNAISNFTLQVAGDRQVLLFQ